MLKKLRRIFREQRRVFGELYESFIFIYKDDLVVRYYRRKLIFWYCFEEKPIHPYIDLCLICGAFLIKNKESVAQLIAKNISYGMLCCNCYNYAKYEERKAEIINRICIPQSPINGLLLDESNWFSSS
jgi:hypothetical protein